jgi:molybdenum cofactor cytidylyltransferase
MILFIAVQLYCRLMNKTGIMILAAGNSSRLGRPKQLLPFRGKNLIAHVVTEALAADLGPVMVVTGAYYVEIYAALKGLPVEIVDNPHWKTGMASGIVAGLAALVIAPELKAVMVAVCDQPYISAELFRSMVSIHAASEKGIVACSYANTLGTPVLFDARYFNELAALSGDGGAKQLLKRFTNDVATVPFPKGEIDIDTEEDFKDLINDTP